MTNKTRSVKSTIEFIQLLLHIKLKEPELERLKNWLEGSYNLAKSDGVIETLERQNESNTR